MATDLAEFVGAAIALNLLFGMPLLPAGLVTAVVAFGLLGLQTRGYRRFEIVIAGMLGVILLGFLVDTLMVASRRRRDRRRLHPGLPGHRLAAAGDRHPRRDRDAARDLPAFGAHPAPGLDAATRASAAGCCASSGST